MSKVVRKSETTVATVGASSRKVSVRVEVPLTIDEAIQLRRQIKEAIETARTQSTVFDGLIASMRGSSFAPYM